VSKPKKGGKKTTDNIVKLKENLCMVGLQEDLDFCQKAACFIDQQVIILESKEVISSMK